MGRIGKTTLARNLFENANVKEHFDIRAWTTISQTFSVLEKLRELYTLASGISRDPSVKMSDSKENAKLNDVSEIEKLDVNQLGGKLYQFLFGGRYFIIMDDMWGIEVWDKIKLFFPDSKNGSRIIVTTRELDLSAMLNESYRVGVKFLDEASSWALFCKTVFGKESCPRELENTGKNIVANCKGLPLSIATIGGLLPKSELTSEHWKLIELNLNSNVIDSNDDICLKILRMSYIYRNHDEARLSHNLRLLRTFKTYAEDFGTITNH
ncbi:disease resistance RPP13-like protein 4 [Salvia splendens]|uniref:disease resistance RPP13-like protein 4 n=1 Tax=Salvia splendens TaxID=180675 RepID=UPI001C27C15F|nr:disease resistance RPP13-like protein 4 [Salvia splendens]